MVAGRQNKFLCPFLHFQLLLVAYSCMHALTRGRSRQKLPPVRIGPIFTVCEKNCIMRKGGNDNDRCHRKGGKKKKMKAKDERHKCLVVNSIYIHIFISRKLQLDIHSTNWLLFIFFSLLPRYLYLGVL